MKEKKLYVYYLPNLDGDNEVIVAAVNQRAACDLMGCSYRGFRVYGGSNITRRERKPNGADEMTRLALEKPGRVLKRPIHYRDRGWTVYREAAE